MSYLHLLQCASPEAVVVLTALLLLALPFLTKRANALRFPVAIAGIALAIGAICMLPAHSSIGQGMLLITPLTSLFKSICLLLAFFTILLARNTTFAAHKNEYLALILFAAVGLMLLVSSEELLMIFIGLELTGLSLYVLTAFDKNDILGVEAGLKYFLFGSTASAFTLFGLSLVYGMCHSTSLAQIAQAFTANPMPPLLLAGITMTLIGFAFKIAAAPFHLWAADTYQAAPIPSAAFIASGSKVASFFVLGKILLAGFQHGGSLGHRFDPGWLTPVAIICALSIIIGNVAALAQRNLRRLLAYSAVAHAGYTLLGLLATGSEGYASTLFYTTIYAFTLIGAFGVIALVRAFTGSDDIAAFTGLVKRSPLLATIMGLFLLSLAGLPPLAGFFGKFYLFLAIFRAGESHAAGWLVTLALAGSLVSLYYYLMVLKAIFVDDPEDHSSLQPVQIDAIQGVTVACLGMGVLLLGIFPDFLATLINNALS